MYAFTWDSGHAIWREWWYTFTSKVSLRTDLFMTWNDHIFVVNVMVIDLTQETMASNVINQPTCAAIKFNTIVKICKYRELYTGHYFISMAMEVHGAHRCDMNCFIKECVRLFHDRWSRGHISLFFYIQFFKQCVNITLQHVLTFVIERKVALAGDACFRPPIIIRFHNLHESNIRGAIGEIISYHERD